MSLSIGIVGLPNVGKSTLFNALLGKAQAEASNFPFCTIEPNIGTVPVPDNRLQILTKLENSAKTIPTTIEFVDIAGLVKGAHQGQGLGNQFLSYIREVDAIIQVIRLFADDNITHITGAIDPMDGIETINTELLLANLQTVEKRLDKDVKNATQNPKLQSKVNFYHLLKQHLEQGKSARTLTINPDNQTFIKELNLLSSKPILYVANLDDVQIQNPNILEPLKKLIETDTAQIIPINAKTEAELVDLNPEEQKNYLKEIGLTEPGLDKVIKASYQLLNLITFFTAGPTETRAWTIPQGTLAPQAGGVIHTDFTKGFIKAEVINYDELVKIGSLKKATEVGKVRQEGKDYIVRDGDVMLFKFNV